MQAFPNAQLRRLISADKLIAMLEKLAKRAVAEKELLQNVPRHKLQLERSEHGGAALNAAMYASVKRLISISGASPYLISTLSLPATRHIEVSLCTPYSASK